MARWMLLGGVLISLLAPAGLWAAIIAPRAAKHASLDERFTRALASARARRWERPVLRGVPVAGNAHSAQVEVIATMDEIPAEALDDFSAQLARGAPPTPAQLALLEAHATALDAYRQTTQRSHASGTYPIELGAAAPFPPVIPHLRASRLLILRASLAPPGECLAILADVIRLGQDRVQGMGLVPLMILPMHARDALAVAPRCIAAADRATLEQAERELAILARYPAPTGSAMESEALYAGASMRSELEATPSLPTDAAQWEGFWRASDVLEAWDLLMGDPASERTIGEDYPADLERVEDRGRDLAARDNDVLSMSTSHTVRFLRRDAAARAIVRMLWAALRVRLAHEVPPDDAPALLLDPSLSDPTSGAPFGWSREDARATLGSERAAEWLDVPAISLTLAWR